MHRWLAAVAILGAMVGTGLATAGATPARPVPASAPAVGSAASSRGPTLSTAPAYNGDFPDPFVMLVGSTYYAYSTGSGGRNLQVMSSSNLSTWGPMADPLPVLPAWASSGLTWAPGVLYRNGVYVMYYTVHDTNAGRQCISLATSSTPQGPFTDNSTGPFVCQLADGGSIDPVPFVAPGGVPYLLWKSDDNAIGARTKLWAQQLTSNGLGLVGTVPNLLLTEYPFAWQNPSMEGPTMVLSGSTYYIFYGAGNWDSANAGIGYGTCSTPLGPCHDKSRYGPWMGSHGNALGPSGPTIFVTSGGATDIAYHAWVNPNIGYPQGYRALWIDTLTFVNGKPVVP